MKMRLEILVTYKCNVQCLDCNRAIGLAKFRDTTLLPSQVKAAVDQVRDAGHYVTRCTLSGGEPLLNPYLQEIIQEADKLPGLRHGRVLTNDVERDGVRKTLKLPKRWEWVPAPIDDPTDPLSGKDQHEPFFVSPADHGIHATWDNCSVRGYCGKGFDAYGWSMCGVAATIGRIIGVDPYWHDGIQSHRKQEEICKHCIYGLTRRQNKKLCSRVHNGELERISPTYKEGLKRHRKTPMEFERFSERVYELT